jgi:hypothetical protein
MKQMAFSRVLFFLRGFAYVNVGHLKFNQSHKPTITPTSQR